MPTGTEGCCEKESSWDWDRTTDSPWENWSVTPDEGSWCPWAILQKPHSRTHSGRTDPKGFGCFLPRLGRGVWLRNTPAAGKMWYPETQPASGGRPHPGKGQVAPGSQGPCLRVGGDSCSPCPLPALQAGPSAGGPRPGKQWLVAACVGSSSAKPAARHPGPGGQPSNQTGS